jgi:hypothetical protein
MGLFYFDIEQRKLIAIEDVVQNNLLPRSVRTISQDVNKFIAEKEKNTNYSLFGALAPREKIVVYNQVPAEKILLYFCKTNNYRRGTVYMAIQITGQFPSILEKCNVTPKIYCTDVVHHSAASFGTTPGIKQCESALHDLLDDVNFSSLVQVAFSYFTKL